ncbi:hypothetical protein VaNZ11_016177 [Volvox africanus]|uniref:Sirohydrochlorin cobaltochelatase n=1 Tax=Volvox africanus TaxID=51714 RepID=A0ABQ5SNJ4_9CHLO|nr:hypothetical protein VaNZ11_016177 [Volvox africanus]
MRIPKPTSAMLSLGPKHTLSTTFRTSQIGYKFALVVNSYQRACEVGWANVNGGPSTSYSVPSRCWRRQQLSAKPRRTAVLTSLKSDESFHAHSLTTNNDDKVGVVIVDHGSRKKASNDMLVEFGELYGRTTGQEIVEIAHMEIARPTIEEAISRCAARGARTVVIAPYFLSRGRHIQEDIPTLVRQAQERYPGLSCVIAEPIGPYAVAGRRHRRAHGATDQQPGGSSTEIAGSGGGGGGGGGAGKDGSGSEGPDPGCR